MGGSTVIKGSELFTPTGYVNNATPEQRLADLETQFANYQQKTDNDLKRFQDAVQKIINSFRSELTKLSSTNSISSGSNESQNSISVITNNLDKISKRLDDHINASSETVNAISDKRNTAGTVYDKELKDTITTLTNKLDELIEENKRIDNLTIKLPNVEKEILEVKTSITGIIEKLKSIDKITVNLYNVEKTSSELKANSSVIDGKLLALNALNTRMCEVTTENKNRDNKILELSNINNQLQNNLANNQRGITALNIKLGELTDKNAKLEAKQADSEYNLNDISARLEKLEADNKKENNLSAEKEIAHKESSEALDDVVAAFNTWSARPTERLAAGFYYVEGDIKIRTTQEILSSNSASKWIANSNGNKKYIFPNPNLFDQLTDISEIFELDSNLIKLAPIGENKIKIIKPCEISDNGFIRHRGEVKLI
ncbi:MAG: hypothetical protein Ta2B_18420 [Termitinemataceae bacterium]|nr:MAG: hypothetical protein Ta2B_18420 [Termitinemataceae bacterium]